MTEGDLLVKEMLKPKVYIGLIVFAMVIALMIFVAAPIQWAWGMWGLAITELILLACGIIPAIVLKWDLREVFQVRKPTFRQILGTLILWFGGYLLVLAINMIIFYLFPEGMSGVSNDLLEFFKSLPFLITLFIVAVMPAVCEEVLHRGFILHTFKGIKNKWVIIISMGFIFGIFHLDPYRFLGTAVLGVLLTYIMVETRNILLPIMFHFVNNALSALSTLGSTPIPEVVHIPLISVGVFLIFAAITPFLFLSGSKLLRTKEENINNPSAKKVKYIAIVTAVILAMTGMGITTASLPIEQVSPLFEVSFSHSVNYNTQPNILEFSVEKDGEYAMVLSIQGDAGFTDMTIINSEGETVYNITCYSLTLDGPIELAAGDYTVIFSYDFKGTDYTPVSVDVIIR